VRDEISDSRALQNLNHVKLLSMGDF